MSIHLYSLSGSPFGWKVQLALEHLGVVHGTSMLSPEAGERIGISNGLVAGDPQPVWRAWNWRN
jgi:glutathione S-transferase